MPLKYTDHRNPVELEAELRALWTNVDLLARRPVAAASSPEPTPIAPTELPEGVVRSWTRRLDWNIALAPYSVVNTWSEPVIFTAPAITHLELWLAIEKMGIGSLEYVIAVGIYPGIFNFIPIGGSGPTIGWTAPVLTVTPGQGIYRQPSVAPLYEFTVPPVDAPRTALIQPQPKRPWYLGDTAFFPIGVTEPGNSRIRVAEVFANGSSFGRATCIRGYLTGRYIEHAVAPSTSWQCSG